MSNMDQSQVTDSVKEYYGKFLKSSDDLKTNACCTPTESIPAHIREALAQVPEEAQQKYYGCGLVIPECLKGARVLDLGCGAGRDCFAIGQLVGPAGHVTGIDMTEEQLAAANRCAEVYRAKFNQTEGNVQFKHGYIERLKEAGVESGVYDVAVSNCVVNLSPDKEAVLSSVYEALKPGGEFYFSDIYADRELDQSIRENKVLWGECLAGAMSWNELCRLATKIGFATPRLVTARRITVSNPELEKILGPACFVSATYRLYKLAQPPQSNAAGLCGVIYEGGVEHWEKELPFDCKFTFQADGMVKVDAELAAILRESRHKEFFSVEPNVEAVKCGKSAEVCVNPFQWIESSSAPSSAAPACCPAKKCC